MLFILSFFKFSIINIFFLTICLIILKIEYLINFFIICMPDWIRPDTRYFSRQIHPHSFSTSAELDLFLKKFPNTLQVAEVDESIYQTGNSIQIFDFNEYFYTYFLGENSWVIVLFFFCYYFFTVYLIWAYYIIIKNSFKNFHNIKTIFNDSFLTVFYPSLYYIVFYKLVYMFQLVEIYEDDFSFGLFLLICVFYCDFIFNYFRVFKLLIFSSEKIKSGTEFLILLPKNYEKKFFFFKGKYLELLFVLYIYFIGITFILHFFELLPDTTNLDNLNRTAHLYTEIFINPKSK